MLGDRKAAEWTNKRIINIMMISWAASKIANHWQTPTSKTKMRENQKAWFKKKEEVFKVSTYIIYLSLSLWKSAQRVSTCFHTPTNAQQSIPLVTHNTTIIKEREKKSERMTQRSERGRGREREKEGCWVWRNDRRWALTSWVTWTRAGGRSGTRCSRCGWFPGSIWSGHTLPAQGNSLCYTAMLGTVSFQSAF